MKQLTDPMEQISINKGLSNSNDFFLQVFNNNAIGMAIADLETTVILNVNTSFLELTGYTEEEIIGKTSLDIKLLEPVKRNQTLIHLKQAGSVNDVEFHVRKKNGELIWVLVSIQTFALNGKKIALTSFIDISERKKAQSQLEQLAAVVESLNDAIISQSPDGTIQSWNKGAERMFGYSFLEAVGNNISLIVPPEYLNEELETIRLLSNGGSAEHYDTFRRKKNGEKVNVSLTLTPIKDESGHIVGFSKIARDITDKVKYSYARNLIEASLDPLVTISADGKITDVNEASVEVTGYSRETLVGTDFLNYFTEPAKAKEGYEKVFEDGFVANYPLTIQHKNGQLTDVLYNASLYKDNKGNVLGVFAAARDITQQKQSTHYARSLIEASLDPLVTINTAGKITDVNEAMVKATDKSREELTGTFFHTYFVEKEKARMVYEEVFDKGYVMNFPLTIIDGVLTDVILSGSVYKDLQGKVKGAVVVARDITQLKKIETELTEAKIFAELALSLAEEAKSRAEKSTRTAEDAVKAKQQFLSNMSHEIRTPMNAIIGFTKVMLKTELSVKQKEYLTAIKLSGDALIVLINDILDLAKVDAGKMVFEQIPFKLGLSIAAILHLFEPKIQEKNLQLIKEYDPAIPDVVVGDPVRLHQIILNLVSNALKFTHAGEITVGVRLLEEDESNATIAFSIADTGIGIPENKLGEIFENFQQASSGTSRLYGGTGLGLAIVKQLVEAQGGRIEVKSKIDAGSTFSFALNFGKTTEEALSDLENTEIDHELKNLKVLVVEDIALNQLLMKTLLDDFGFQKDIAANGKIAIEKMQSGSYDIILMDLQMPEMNGFEATQFIRNTLGSNIPIIALTADVTTADLAKCKAVGMNDYLAKPVDEKLLYSKIIGLVKQSATRQNHKLKEDLFSKPDPIKCIDLNYLNQRTKSNPKLMMEMISLYLEQTPLLIREMKKSFHDKDWKVLYAAVHKMIPSFAIMGINADFENMARKIKDYAGARQNSPGIPALVLQLENICNQACNELTIELEIIKTANP